MQLRLYQCIGLLSMLATAYLAAAAVETATPREGARMDGAHAAALVLFSPLAVIEGTLSGHNDGLLAVTVALAALLYLRRQTFWAVAALGSGLVVKDSAILLLALCGLHMSRLRLSAAPPRVRRLAWLGAAIAGCVVVWLFLARVLRYSPTSATLLGHGREDIEYCVRSIECLPRAAFFWLLHMPRVALAINLSFRAAAGVFLFYIAHRSTQDGRFLRWAAAFLFFYYLYFHSFSQSWYLLSLLPLLPFADKQLWPPICTFLISLVVYYALDIPMSCGGDNILRWAATHVLEGVVVIIPATISLIRTARRPRDFETPTHAS